MSAVASKTDVLDKTATAGTLKADIEAFETPVKFKQVAIAAKAREAHTCKEEKVKVERRFSVKASQVRAAPSA